MPESVCRIRVTGMGIIQLHARGKVGGDLRLTSTAPTIMRVSP